MLKIPYISAPKNACALACYTMTAKYYFPEITYDQIAKISNWRPNYVVWPFRFWSWIMDKGIKITDYDLIDYKSWSAHGSKALKETLSEKEFNWLVANSTDLDELSADIRHFLEHKNFTHMQERPKYELLKNAANENKVCEVVLDSRTLDRQDGFSLHRVVITNIDEGFITFHDPREKPTPDRKEKVSHFINSWLDAVEDPELCIYSQ